jgi:predicted nucleic acid-binding protein
VGQSGVAVMSLVLDASVTLAWIYEDETTEGVQDSFDLVSTNGAWVPVLWLWEVANVLQMNVRRGRHNTKFRDRALADLALFPIREDAEAGRQAWSGSLTLAERHGLTVYDAAYLEVALRRGLPLATLDQDLRRAASAEKVQLLGG